MNICAWLVAALFATAVSPQTASTTGQGTTAQAEHAAKARNVASTGQSTAAAPAQDPIRFRPAPMPPNQGRPGMMPPTPGVPMQGGPMQGPGHPVITVTNGGNMTLGPNDNVQFQTAYGPMGGGSAPVVISQSGWLYIYDHGFIYKVRQSDMKLIGKTQISPDAPVEMAVPQPVRKTSIKRRKK